MKTINSAYKFKDHPQFKGRITVDNPLIKDSIKSYNKCIGVILGCLGFASCLKAKNAEGKQVIYYVNSKSYQNWIKRQNTNHHFPQALTSIDAIVEAICNNADPEALQDQKINDDIKTPTTPVIAQQKEAKTAPAPKPKIVLPPMTEERVVNEGLKITKYFVELVGGYEAYNKLPILDLSQFPKWTGMTNYPDSIPIEAVTAPVTRCINGFKNYDYLLIKYKSADRENNIVSEKPIIEVLFGEYQDTAPHDCRLHGGGSGWSILGKEALQALIKNGHYTQGDVRFELEK